MAIFYENNMIEENSIFDEDMELFNEAADYVIGCLNEEYEVDTDLLRESAEFVLDCLEEGSDYKNYQIKQAKKKAKDAYMASGNSESGKANIKDDFALDLAKAKRSMNIPNSSARAIKHADTQRDKDDYESGKKMKLGASRLAGHFEYNRRPGEYLKRQEDIDKLASDGKHAFRKTIRSEYRDNKKGIKNDPTLTKDAKRYLLKALRNGKKKDMGLVKSRVNNAQNRGN